MLHACVIDKYIYSTEFVQRIGSEHSDRRGLKKVGAIKACFYFILLRNFFSYFRTIYFKSVKDDVVFSCSGKFFGNAQANAALANEQGINADINATLGRNWQLGGTQNIEAQSMRRQAGGYADQVLNNCMRVKGFKKEG